MSSFLNISEIERLAKAGVKIELDSITPQSDPPEPWSPQHEPMAAAIWDRYNRTKRAVSSPMDGYRLGHLQPFELLASRHGDKVWVSVHPLNFVHEPFQLQDDALTFPSDTLMASLAMWEKGHPSG